MYRGHSVGVVIPAYNEEPFVATVVQELPAFVDTVYLVDDASTDGTWQAMRNAMGVRAGYSPGRRGPRPVLDRFEPPLANRLAAAEELDGVMRLQHDENRGAGGAIKTGYQVALADGIDVIATVDGDGQMDSSDISRLLDPVVAGEAGYAKGNRFAGENVVREMPAFRLLGNVVLTGLTRVASGYWRLSDPQNGFTAISREALSAVDLEVIWEYYGYMNQLMAQLNSAGVDVADVPMPSTYGEEESNIHYPEYIRRVSLLLLVSLLQRFRTKYATGGLHLVPISYAIGVGFGITGLSERLRQRKSDSDLAPNASPLTKVLVSGVAFAVAAMLDRATPPYAVDAPPRRGDTTGDPLEVEEGA